MDRKPKYDAVEKKDGSFDSWNAGGSDAYLYTENWDFAKELRKEFGHGGVYFRNCRAMAWQFKVPNRLLPLLRKKLEMLIRDTQSAVEEEIAQKLDVDFQRVTGREKVKLALRDSKRLRDKEMHVRSKDGGSSARKPECEQATK